MGEGQARADDRRTVQFEQINNANPATYTGVLSLAYNAYSTANFSGTQLSNGTTGNSFASYLLGAVAGSPSNATSAHRWGCNR